VSSNETYWIHLHPADMCPNETLPWRKWEQERMKRRRRLLNLSGVHWWRGLP